MSEQRPGLVRYKGCYWLFRGTKDAAGRLSLDNPFDSSGGILADPKTARIVTGDEYERQMEAIEAEWFRRLKAPSGLDS